MEQKPRCESRGSESQVTPPQGKVEEGAAGSSCSPQPSAHSQSLFLLSGRQRGEATGCHFCAALDTSFHPLQEGAQSRAHLCGFMALGSIAVGAVVAA